MAGLKPPNKEGRLLSKKYTRWTPPTYDLPGDDIQIEYNPLETDDDIDQYIEEQRVEFREEWFQYLEDFYDLF